MALTWELPESVTLDPAQEAERLEALHSLHLRESGREDRFDRVTRLAAAFFNVKAAYVAFIDADRQWFKSRVGPCPAETSRKESFCQYTIQRDEPLIIPDTHQHPMARNHPYVQGEPYVRFYAGVPLSGPRGLKIGTFCLLDTKPRSFDDDDRNQLLAFATIVQREIDLAEIIQVQRELLVTRQALFETQEKLQREFDDAAKYVRLMLPPPLSGREAIDWIFEPSTHLGGDGLGYRRLDEDRIAFYVLDVTGHGLGSALLAVTALELLRARTSNMDYTQPGLVIERLNRTFQMKEHNGKFFSAWYGIYSHSRREITYANGGHPPPLLVTPGKKGPVLTKIEPGGPVLGVMPEIKVTEGKFAFPSQSELYLFTDGLYETKDAQNEHGSYNDFHAHLQAQVQKGRAPYPAMREWLDAAHERGSIDDDVSLLRFMTTP